MVCCSAEWARNECTGTAYTVHAPASAAAGDMRRLALDPMATPPANVAFWMCTISSLPCSAADAPNAARHAPCRHYTERHIHTQTILICPLHAKSCTMN